MQYLWLDSMAFEMQSYFIMFFLGGKSESGKTAKKAETNYNIWNRNPVPFSISTN